MVGNTIYIILGFAYKHQRQRILKKKKKKISKKQFFSAFWILEGKKTLFFLEKT